jgi:O-antigen ligase
MNSVRSVLRATDVRLREQLPAWVLAHRLKLSISAAIALVWLYLHPLAPDQLNLNILAVVLVLLLAVSFELGARRNGLDSLALTVMFSLGILSLLATALAGGRFPEFRDIIAIVVVISLGLIASALVGTRAVLWGVLMGSGLIAILGWSLTIARSGWTMEYSGVTGNAGPEHFSALVGFVAGLALLSASRVPTSFAIFSLTFLGLTLLMAGATIGVLVLFAVGGFAFCLFLLRRATRGVLVTICGVLGAGVVAVLWVLSNRDLAVAIASRVGEQTSVVARYEIWESALQSVTLLGVFIGHGVFFWNHESPRHAEVAGRLEDRGLPMYSHAHSLYLDLFLAFGIVGLTVVAVLVALVARRGLFLGRQNAPWSAWAAPFLFLFALGAQGISQSNLVQRPAGWFLIGLLLGSFALVSARGPAKIPRKALLPVTAHGRPDDPTMAG